jgi:hypothetical protein
MRMARSLTGIHTPATGRRVSNTEASVHEQPRDDHQYHERDENQRHV